MAELPHVNRRHRQVESMVKHPRTEMEITKNKNPRLAYKFLNSYPSIWIFIRNHKDLTKLSRLLVRGFFS
jgi:hypothetical protein